MLDDLPEIRRRVERIQRERDEAAGGLKQLIARLKEEFGVSSVREGRELKQKLETEELTIARRYAKALEEFKGKEGDALSRFDTERSD